MAEKSGGVCDHPGAQAKAAKATTAILFTTISFTQFAERHRRSRVPVATAGRTRRGFGVHDATIPIVVGTPSGRPGCRPVITKRIIGGPWSAGPRPGRDTHCASRSPRSASPAATRWRATRHAVRGDRPAPSARDPRAVARQHRSARCSVLRAHAAFCEAGGILLRTRSAVVRVLLQHQHIARGAFPWAFLDAQKALAPVLVQAGLRTGHEVLDIGPWRHGARAARSITPRPCTSPRR